MIEDAPGRFLLYIDILGFSDMTRNDPRSVARTYAILNKLNAHKDVAFKTIVFSDTVLVYNPQEANNDTDRHFLVWYLTEFAEDLYHKLVGQNIWFRAILLAGDFHHYQLENIECFYGMALIDAYLAEKRLPMMGLALHSSCLPYNQYFRLEPFTDEFSFVYLSRPLENLHRASADRYPVTDWALVDQAPNVPEGVRYLSDVYHLMRSHPDPNVRAKALTTWDFHARRYPGMIAALLASGFQLSALAPTGAWAADQQTLKRNIKFYKRAGAGTEMSLSFTKRRPTSLKHPLRD